MARKWIGKIQDDNMVAHVILLGYLNNVPHCIKYFLLP
jgi:hypothetical protein